MGCLLSEIGSTGGRRRIRRKKGVAKENNDGRTHRFRPLPYYSQPALTSHKNDCLPRVTLSNSTFVYSLPIGGKPDQGNT
jgi:hypothetical protein